VTLRLSSSVYLLVFQVHSVSLQLHNNNYYVSIIRNQRNSPDCNSINTETCDIIFLSWTFSVSDYSVNINYVWWTYAKPQRLCLKIVCNTISAFKFCTIEYARNCFIYVSNLVIYIKILKKYEARHSKAAFSNKTPFIVYVTKHILLTLKVRYCDWFWINGSNHITNIL